MYFAQNTQNGTTFGANLLFSPHVSFRILEIFKGKQIFTIWNQKLRQCFRNVAPYVYCMTLSSLLHIFVGRYAFLRYECMNKEHGPISTSSKSNVILG